MEERSPYISIFHSVNLTSLRLMGGLEIKFIPNLNNLARTVRLGRKANQLILFILQPDPCLGLPYRL
jgi:hypothetical protein